MEEKFKNLEILTKYVAGQLMFDRSSHELHGELEDAGWSQGEIAEAFAIASYAKRYSKSPLSEEEKKHSEQVLEEYKNFPMPKPIR